ncbi:Polyisoprenoid-binding protein [Beijerinckiaceae bacterium RH AL1]|nr:YceI family protein [Beijerinckiaceae bacterium]VVB43485.1 Polyisoprenoid-binding protein [Beijerinckiaceae bacterium RH AL8]VVB43502.1 Polyisoprenoid-binding protein [Beijerinckiaceae bacterium RH CH11]VVC53866.1 Polyisoprenoid-binding protein [Beijerinckiaceae bacterium RH AL1]
MKTHALSLAILLACAAAVRAGAQSASHDPAKVEAGTYSVEPNHTQVMFTVSHMGFSNYTGSFTGASGDLTLDPKTASASALKVSVPVASVMTPSAKLVDELKSADWLDAGKYPTMTFVSTKVTPLGKGRAKVTGDLTIHGTTKPATLDVTFVGAGTNPLDKKYTVGFEAKGDIKRSEFGVSKYVPLIGDTLHLTIAGAFERQ